MIRILITGDFCPIGRTAELNASKNYDLIFNDFLPVLKNNDLAITNLECPLLDTSSGINKTGPALKASTSSAEILKFGNIGLVTLANNHIMDHGDSGLNSTIEVCVKNNIDYVGAGKNLEDARKPFIKEIKRKKIGVLNFAENEFSNTHGNYPGANPLSIVSNFNDIKALREKVDYLIVIFHGGNEMHPLPSPRVKETLRFFADCGADTVIAHHTHCFSGFEKYNNCNIFYGIGNFLFDYRNENENFWNKGLAVQLYISETTGEKDSFEIIPFYQSKTDKAGITLINEQEKKEIDEKLDRYNDIILNDNELQKEFNKFVNSKKQMYWHYLEPYSQRVLQFLYRRKLIPSFLRKRKRLLYLNLIRCESHRDIILKLLEEK